MGFTRLKLTVIPLLLLISGFCGISYEILYTKLLGNLLGSQFTINATVLLTFLGGIGIGTLYAHRFLKYLWLIEAGIGLYALVLTLSYGPLDQLIYSQLPTLGTNILASACVAFIILAIPSFLVGCSLPLFAAYLGESRQEHVFATTYSIYNLGAVFTALILEFVVLRLYGLIVAMQALALLNLVVAGSLFALIKITRLSPAVPSARKTFAPRLLFSLFVVSIASAIFQLLGIKIFEFVFGPFNETFALVLAVVLFGIAMGSTATGWLRLTYKNTLIVALFGLVFFLALFRPVMTLYAALYPVVVDEYSELVTLKLGIVFILMFIPALGFGATVPALLSRHEDIAKDSGFLLFTSSMGNVLGFLVMTFFLHQYFDYGPLIVSIGCLIVFALVVNEGIKSFAVPIACVLLLAGYYSTQNHWQEDLLYISHKNFRSVELLEDALDDQSSIEKFKGAQDVFAIVSLNNEPYFFINGYISIPLESANEKLVGAISTMLAPDTRRALVLGVGSGATAGTVGLMFDETEAVEINKVVLDNLDLMTKYNFNITSRENVRLIHDDGIRYVKNVTEPYSLILNTVTSPQFFSSSKLYTREFFEIVKQKLTPEGIYVTWADGKIGPEGMNVVMQTLGGAFDHCALAYIRSNYFLFVCSKEEVSVRNLEKVTGNSVLEDYFASTSNFPIEFLPYLVLSTHALEKVTSLDAPVNTMDFPVLEHLMARVPSGSLASFRSLILNDKNFASLVASMSASTDWRPGEFSYFAETRLRSRGLRRLIRNLVYGNYEDADTQYIEAIKRHARLVETRTGYDRAFDELISMDECGQAESFYAEVPEKFSSASYYDIGKCHYFDGQYEDAYQAFELQWQRNQFRKAALYLARSQIKRKAFSDALLWLEKARETERDISRVDYYEGIAHEGLGNTDMAAKFYQAVLKDNDSDQYNESRRRLLRIQSTKAAR